MLTDADHAGAVPAAGETIKAEATGDFTLHGVTKKVTVSLEGRWDGKQVQVVGNLPIVFGDYGITAPDRARGGVGRRPRRDGVPALLRHELSQPAHLSRKPRHSRGNLGSSPAAAAPMPRPGNQPERWIPERQRTN